MSRSEIDYDVLDYLRERVEKRGTDFTFKSKRVARAIDQDVRQVGLSCSRLVDWHFLTVIKSNNHHKVFKTKLTKPLAASRRRKTGSLILEYCKKKERKYFSTYRYLDDFNRTMDKRYTSWKLAAGLRFLVAEGALQKISQRRYKVRRYEILRGIA